MTKYTPVIGLEVHVELKTQSKMFCGCSADYFGKEPNTHTCPVCLGLPGALPVPNKKAIDWCVMIALALNCEINKLSKFDRKNYFYPDLPKGYQISQYDLPFGKGGHVILNEVKDLDSSPSAQNDNGKRIRIRRVHMEEDTAKLIHASSQSAKRLARSEENVSLIDFNRSGVPLVEIVTEPDFTSAEEVALYLKRLQQIVRYLGVSNADMEKGDMRLEPNISLQATGDMKHVKSQNVLPFSSHGLPPYKVEVKNINSFRFVEKAIIFEIKRQAALLDEGRTPPQETRGWHEAKGETFSQRVKEEANDYRYFPEPDIPPITFTDEKISTLRSQMPELPDTILSRFMSDFSLSVYDAEILTREKALADYFEEAVNVGKEHNISPKQIANVIINKKPHIEEVLPASLVKQIVASTQTVAVDEKELEKVIKKVLEENEKAVTDFKNGKENAILFLVGQVMRQFRQKLDAQSVKNVLIQRIK